MKLLWFVEVAVLVAVLPHSALGAETRISAGATTVTATIAGSPVEVTVTTISPVAEYAAKESWRWGAEGSLPKLTIKSCSVSVGGRPVFIPISAFINLGNPSRIAVTRSKSGFRIDIRGGDAATSYKAELFFIDGVLKRRRVAHGEFPEEAWEESVYSFNL